MRLITALKGLARYDGLSYLPGAALGALKCLDFHIYLLRPDLMPELPTPEGFEFHAEALERLRRLRKGRSDLPNEFWRDQINGAQHCFIAERGGTLAAVTWIYMCPAKRMVLVLAPDDGETSATHVLSEFRGHSLYRTLSVFAARAWLASHPRSRLFTVAASDNPIPLAQIPRMGYVELAVLRRNSLFGPRFHTGRVHQ